MSNHILETTYRGAHLKLEISEGKTQLLINGLVRDEGSSEKPLLRLSSVVQTDYEWHELIEGFVSFEPGSITVSLLANNMNVAQKSYKLSGE